MIAIDTNILVYAHREESPFHLRADQCVTELSESGSSWCIPWPCLHEFLVIVTHPRIYKKPTTREIAVQEIKNWMESPSFHAIGEEDDYWAVFSELLISTKVQGPQIHDLKIASICLSHKVSALWSTDRDFSRFPRLKIVNPLL